MIRNGSTAIAGIALAFSVGTSAALAGPIGALMEPSASEGLVHKVWGCHRSCELGPRGWHRHVGPQCVRVVCWPRAEHPNRCWVDRWGVRHCRW